MTPRLRACAYAAAVAAGLLGAVVADARAASSDKAASPDASSAIFPGTSSKDPISIDADKLVYFDKERKAVYTGNVVVIQGDTKLTCSAMTILLDRAPTPVRSPRPPSRSRPLPATRASSIWTRRVR